MKNRVKKQKNTKPERRKNHKPAPRKQNQELKLARPSLYGTHAISEAWLNEERHITALYLTDQAASGFEPLIEQARRKGLKRPDPTLLDKHQLDKLLPQGAVHQGIAIVCSSLPEYGLQDITIRADQQDRSLILILDQVTDPHNVGAIVRSACAFGVNGLIMQKKHAPELSGVLAKTACGAIEHVPVAFETNLSRSIEELQSDGYFVYGLDERGEQNINEISPPEKCALVLGAEGPGIRRLVKDHCDGLLRLPMHGPMPSINVSNAAAVALYEFSKS